MFDRAFSKLALCLIFLFYAVWVSLPILYAGYYADDIPNGLTLGVTQVLHRSVFDISQELFWAWIQNGRFFPVAIFCGYPFFYIFHTIISYQIAHAIVIWLSFFAVAWLVKLISKEWTAALLVLFLIPVFWSIRNYSDPLVSYAILLPFVTLFSILTLCFFIKAIESKKIVWHVCAIIFYLFALFTYETAYAAFFAILLISFLNRSSIKQFFLQMMSYTIISFAYFILLLYLRLHFPNHLYEGFKFGTLSNDFLHAFFNQLSAGLPLSYKLFAAKRYFKPPLLDPYIPWGKQLLVVAILFLLALFPFYYLIRKLILDRKALISFIILGLTFTITPSLLISLSQKYQHELRFGVGYLPVYMEYVGFALLLLACIGAIKKHSMISFSLSFTLSLIVSFAFLVNYSTIRIENNLYFNTRVLTEHALYAGLFSDLPLMSTVIKRNGDAWNSPEFYMQNAGIRVQVLELKSLVAPGSNFSSIQATYFIDYYTFPESKYGYVILSKIKMINNQKIILSDPEIFLQSGRYQFIFLAGSAISMNEIVNALQTQLKPLEHQKKITIAEQQSTVLKLKGEYELSS